MKETVNTRWCNGRPSAPDPHPPNARRPCVSGGGRRRRAHHLRCPVPDRAVPLPSGDPDLPTNRPGLLHHHPLEPQRSYKSGIAAVMYGTIVIAIIALVIAVPISLLTALFLTEYAPRCAGRCHRGRPARRRAQPDLRHLGLPLSPAAPAGGRRWLTDNFGFIPIFPRTRHEPRVLDVHRRRGGVADGPADRHRRHARGVLPGAARREGGGPGPGRHPLGDDPHGRAAVRARRHHRRLDAGARPGAGRDDRGRSSSPPRSRSHRTSSRPAATGRRFIANRFGDADHAHGCPR